MRYPAAEKLEIIQLVEQSHLPVRLIQEYARASLKSRGEWWPTAADRYA